MCKNIGGALLLSTAFAFHNVPHRTDSTTTDYSRADATWADQPRIIISIPGVRLSRCDLLGCIIWNTHRNFTLPPPQRRQRRTMDHGKHGRLGCQHHRPFVDCFRDDIVLNADGVTSDGGIYELRDRGFLWFYGYQRGVVCDSCPKR